jgi:predicted NAD-dependent protein-ADP-ribosyltransferase YbiA (DUF1768 family)
MDFSCPTWCSQLSVLPHPTQRQTWKVVTAHQMIAIMTASYLDDVEQLQTLRQSLPTRGTTLQHSIRQCVTQRHKWFSWQTAACAIVHYANSCKFSNNQALAQKLIQSLDTVIAYAQPLDGGLGTRESAKSDITRIPSDWRGANVLGAALMCVRYELGGHKPPWYDKDVSKINSKLERYVQGVTGHSWYLQLTTNKTVVDIKDTVRLSVNPPLRRDQLAIICVAKSNPRAKQSILPDTTETETIDFSTFRLFVVLRLRAEGGSGGSGDARPFESGGSGVTQQNPARDPPLPHARALASPQVPETSDTTIRAGSTDSEATQDLDYDSDMAPHHTAVVDTWAPQHHNERAPILDSETSDRNKRSHDNPVNNRVQLCPAAVLAAVHRGNNMQARQHIPTWLLLQSDTWARQAQHPIPQDAVTLNRELFKGRRSLEPVGSRTDTVARGKRGSSGWIELY